MNEDFNQPQYWIKQHNGTWILWENKHLKEKVAAFVDPKIDDYEKLQQIRK